MTAARGAAAIVGAADAVSPTGELEGSVRYPLADAGLALADVDAVACCTGGIGMPSLELAEYLGVHPAWTDSTQTGGSSFELQLEHLTDAIAAGRCHTGLIVYAATPRSARRRGGGR